VGAGTWGEGREKEAIVFGDTAKYSSRIVVMSEALW